MDQKLVAWHIMKKKGGEEILCTIKSVKPSTFHGIYCLILISMWSVLNLVQCKKQLHQGTKSWANLPAPAGRSLHFPFTCHINWCQSTLTHFSWNEQGSWNLFPSSCLNHIARRTALGLQDLVKPYMNASPVSSRTALVRMVIPYFHNLATSLKS